MKTQLLKISILLCIISITTLKAQMISTFAGTGTLGYAGDGGYATSAELNGPIGLVVDSSGNIYIADGVSMVVRKVDAAGVITTFAGTGTPGYSGDGGPATSALLNNPSRIGSDGQGNIYIIDNLNQCIRKVDGSGIITTVAGNGLAGYTGDGGPAVNATLNSPRDVAFDNTGNMYITDQLNNVIRMVNTSGIISTFAGNGTAGYSGDGGPALSAQFDYLLGITADASDNLYIGDFHNHVIRKIDASGIISTFAGNGTPGNSGDGYPATSAELNGPNEVVMDAAGNFYIADQYNYSIRKVDPSGIITTFAGTGTPGYSGDGGQAVQAQFNGAKGMAIDAAGNFYIGDFGNHVVRVISESVGITQLEGNKIPVTVSPNPFVNVADIKFELPGPSEVNITIVDMIGKEVEILCNKFLQSGTQHLQWNAAKYQNGIYFCRLTVSGITSIQKLVKY